MKRQNDHHDVLLQHLNKIYFLIQNPTFFNSILLISLNTKGESLLPLKQVIRALRNVVHVFAIIVPVSTSF